VTSEANAGHGEQAPAAEQVVSGEVAPQRYVGLITRGIGFALDAAVLNGVAVAVSLGVALILSVFPLSHKQKTLWELIGAAVYASWWVGYFVAFWWTTGQTPGARAMRFRVDTVSGGGLALGWALVRWVGLVLAALPLFAGYLLIPFNSQRRGLQDLIARTVVVEAPTLSAGERRRRQRAQRRAAARAAAATPAPSSDPGEDSDGASGQADPTVWQATPAATTDKSGSPG
jgi:uncharacterized RDD family membrane protein YckC